MALKKLKREESFVSRIAVNKGAGLSSLATAERNRAARTTAIVEDFAKDTLQEIQREQQITARDLASTYIPNPKSTEVQYEYNGNLYRSTINTFEKPELPDAINTRTGADLYRRLATEKYNRRLLQEVQLISDKAKKESISNMIDGRGYQDSVALALQPFLDTLEGSEKELALSYAKTYLDSSSVDVELSFDANQREVNFLTFQIEIDKDLPVLLNKAVDSAISDEEFLLDWNTTYNLAKAYESIISPKNKPKYKEYLERIEGAKVYRNLFLDIPLAVKNDVNPTDNEQIINFQITLKNLRTLEQLARFDSTQTFGKFTNKLGEEVTITREQLLSAFGSDAIRLNKLSQSISTFVVEAGNIETTIIDQRENYSAGVNVAYGSAYTDLDSNTRKEISTIVGIFDGVKTKLNLEDDDTFTYESLNNIDVRTKGGRDIVEGILANDKKRAVINEVLRVSNYELMPTIFRDSFNALVLDPNNKNAQDLVLSIFTPENGIVFGGGFDPEDDRNLYYLPLALDGVLDSTIGVTVNQGHQAVHQNRLRNYLEYIKNLDQLVTPASTDKADRVISNFIADSDGILNLVVDVIDDPLFYESLQKSNPDTFKAINAQDSDLADLLKLKDEDVLGDSFRGVGFSENRNVGAINAKEQFKAILDNNDTNVIDAMSFVNIENQARFILPSIKTEKEMIDVLNKIVIEEFKRNRFGISSIASPYKFDIGINSDNQGSLNLIAGGGPEAVFSNNIELVNFKKYAFSQILDNPTVTQMIANKKDLDYRSIGEEFKLFQTDYSSTVYTIRPFDSEFGYQTDLVGDDGNVIRIQLNSQLITAIKKATFTDLTKD